MSPKVRDHSKGDEGTIIFNITFPPEVREEAEAFLRNGGTVEEAVRRYLRISLNSSSAI